MVHGINYPLYSALCEGVPVFDGAVARRPFRLPIVVGDLPAEISGETVTGNFFQMSASSRPPDGCCFLPATGLMRPWRW
jgi:hypothetical protein